MRFTPQGLWCPRAGVHVDPRARVPCAVITHAHSDHARRGMGMYIAHHHTIPLLRERIGSEIRTQGLDYGEPFERNGVRISLHPSGHVAGSAQVRIDDGREVWVISGDYKIDDDGVGIPFTPVPCDTFVTESTFGLPIYRWEDPKHVFDDIHRWWAQNSHRGITSVLYCYSLGKAQRLLRHLDPDHGPILAGASIVRTTHLLAGVGFQLPRVEEIAERSQPELRGALVLIPPSGLTPSLVRRLTPFHGAFVSGWMATRKGRNRNGSPGGFVLSDHADWDGLNHAVNATGARRVYVTHGYARQFSRWLREQGFDAQEAPAQ
jgi:putative mRNA 3-end processing factor